ncbi:MBL fold metallo-hydrolase [Micromonospora qiuiae]|uniref:MBL fold metallo-hydrolase n=1 Tax=Micromonospora qiuiae TaxID=502268 RepID=UPI001EF32FEE|nr:MBL fold metallo-hydrolase [Micromonospora qiuiae]
MTFVGTATTVLRLGSFTLLTDPNFLHSGQRAYLGYGLFSRRLTNPATRIENLPDLDAVVLSHMHGDHFDRTARHGLPKSLPIITTPQAQRRLKRWGFAAADGLATWERRELHHGNERLSITSVPGHHGPGLLDRLLPAVMGSIIDLDRDGRRVLRLYITGDTLYRPSLAEIPDRFPDIDAMLIHLGGTRILGFLVTMDDRQGVDLMRLVKPEITLPIHYDDYRVFRSPLQDFLATAARHGLRPAIQTLRRGETRPLFGHRYAARR